MDTMFNGALISVLEDTIVYAYMRLSTDKEMWEALEAKFELFDATSCISWSRE